jgi:opine dehydrogenase
MTQARYAIIGAGNGGHAFVVHVGLSGSEVSLYDIDERTIEAIKTRGAIRAEGALVGTVTPACATTDMGEALAGAKIAMVVVPACYHELVAKSMAPHLVDGQVIVLNPGATGGALLFRRVLREAGCQAKVVIAETLTLLYACRATAPGEVTVYGLKKVVEVAALPASATVDVTTLLCQAMPQFVPVPNVLHTSLSNVNSVVHPAPTLLNAGRVESGQPFEYYHEGITPTVAKVADQVDQERLAVAQAAGLKLDSARGWYGRTYDAQGETLYDAIRNNDAYAGIGAPVTLDTRYIFEDVPTGLVPMTLLGEALGVNMPLSRALVEVANAAHGCDYWVEGRSLEKLGLAAMGPEQICEAVEN